MKRRIHLANKTLVTFVALTIFVVISRLLPHIPNVTPLGGLTLISGSVFSLPLAAAITFTSLFFSDSIIGFHSNMVYVYVGFAISLFIGYKIKNEISLSKVLFGSILSSLFFFIITNLGVWLEGKMYPMNLQGLAQCYSMAIPFFRNSLLGDLFYSGLFYGLYAILISWHKRLSFV